MVSSAACPLANSGRASARSSRSGSVKSSFTKLLIRPAWLTRLEKYFAGDLDALAGIIVDTGGTPFQQRVWSELRKIPVGRTASYGDIARAIGAPTAVRAVGAANGANPVGIVVPCHRVIGTNGNLTGYGGGIERKRWLLRHESAQHELRVA